jgi:ribosomal protein L11 methyltransferase
VTAAPDWRSVTVRVPAGNERNAVIAALFDAGAEGVQELPNDIVTHAPGGAAADAFAFAAAEAAPGAPIVVAPLPPVDWSEQWKALLRRQELGALTIAPPWLADDLDPRRTVVIDPGMAFGTGDHATTRGVVRLLQSVVRPCDRVADLGAGSAVLAIAATKLGAAHAAAIELDGDAISNAESNVARNGVTQSVVVIHGDAATLLPLIAPVRVITANILSSVILTLLPVMAAALAPDGVAVISGIMATERDDMLRALDAGGWRIVAEDREDEWWTAAIARR